MLFFCVFAALFLCACAKGNLDSAGSKTQPGDAIALLAENGAVGASAQVFDPILGAGQATVSESYISALGRACRRIYFIDQAGRRHNLAACADDKGIWATAPPIFARPMM